MKNLELTTWERATLVIYINSAGRGNLSQIRRYFRLLDVLELSEEEKSLVGWKDDEKTGPTWEDMERTFVLTLEDADFDLLSKATDWNGWRVDRLTLALLEKLGR